MTPDDIISAAFRAASKELSRSPIRPDNYEGFMIATSEHLDQAAQFLSKIAEQRNEASLDTLTMLEHYGMREMLQATVSALLALGHYPYLDRIDMPDGEGLQ